MPSIAERLAAAKRASFVGRSEERTLFEDALAADKKPTFSVLYLYGPGGVGKTALLAAFVDLCDQNKVPHLLLDGRRIEPSPAGILAALRSGLHLDDKSDPLTVLAEPGRRILLIDTYEQLATLDGWLRDVFLPGISEDVLIVVAGRQSPAPEWSSEPGWQSLMRTVPLRNLSPLESQEFLSHKNVPTGLHTSAIHFTHGHPLALSLLAEVCMRESATTEAASRAMGPNVADLTFASEAMPDVVQTLLDRFIESVPGPLHRAALEVCALLRVTDEGLLEEMLHRNEGPNGTETSSPDGDRNRALFNWLRGLSFIESAPGGVFPHDVVREALLADLRWRDGGRYIELHRRARNYYAQRLAATKLPAEQQRLLYDCIFLHRDNPIVRAAFDWQQSPAAYPDMVRGSDVDILVETVRRYEGDESAAMASLWLARQPERTLVFRDFAQPTGEPAGFYTMLSLRDMTPDERAADPAIAAAWGYLQNRSPLRAGETASYLRFWMAQDSYQSPSPVQSLIIVQALRHFLTGSSLAFTFFASADADQWEPIFDYVQIRRLRDAEFLVGGRRYGVYGHDWRTTPISSWLERLFENEVAAADTPAPGARPRSKEDALIVLSEPEFVMAMRDALKGLHQPNALLGSPLLRSRIVAGRVAPAAGSTERAAMLRQRIQEAVTRLKGSRKQARGARALHLTYLEPGGTQERIADLLDVPFNTYRRHLGEGITALTDLLWHEELSDDE